MKPHIFIGSSKEDIEIAEAIENNIKDISYPVIWDQGLTTLSESTLNNLFKALEKNDFAIFVFGAEDRATIRNEQTSIVRDNVIFETGLFMGKLGKDRVFFVKPQNVSLHLPTDLMGITYGLYDPGHPNKNASLRSFCNQVKSQIKNINIRPIIPDDGEYGTNILNKNIEFFKSNSSSSALSYSYGLYAKTSSNQKIKMIIENKSNNSKDNLWCYSVIQKLGWVPTVYNVCQEFVLYENSRGILKFYFIGRGNAIIKVFLNQETEPFLQKEIYWE